MKTAYLLFGLASACVSGQPNETQYPLCGNDGAPACGNIGQVGRDKATFDAATALAAVHASATGSTATAFVTSVADTPRRMITARRMVPWVVTRVLVGASSEIQRVTPLHRPLVDHREEAMCGNVMTKGGRTRRCRDASGVTTEVDLDADGTPTGNPITYDVTP